jgi:hypothetical protein
LPPPPDDAGDDYDSDHLLMGCAPYLQIFKAGQLVFTTAAALHYNQSKDELPFCQVADGALSFHIENVIQGDILVRCRHLTAQGQRVSMFRAAFHTGYVPPNVMRLTKEQLDGACTDKRFPDDFFMDLIFEPCGPEMASKHLSGKADAVASAAESLNEAESQNEASQRRDRGTMAGADVSAVPPKTGDGHGATVTASAYDSMLHRDSRFWDVIAARRHEHAQLPQDDQVSGDQFFGPTVGRRRHFGEKPKNEDTEVVDQASSVPKTESALPTFSIGGDFDFMLPNEIEPDPEKIPDLKEPKERDELMDALNAIDNDSPVAVRKPRRMPTEEIRFEAPPVVADATQLFKEEVLTDISVEEKAGTARTEPEPASKAPEKSDSVAAVEATAILDDADLDMDEDVDAFLASSGAGEREEDVDVDDFDFDDDDLDDLESFLTTK